MGLMTGNGNIARLRSGASVDRRQIVIRIVAQASRRFLRFLLVINFQTNPNAKFDFTQQIRPDSPCLDTCRMEK